MFNSNFSLFKLIIKKWKLIDSVFKWFFILVDDGDDEGRDYDIPRRRRDICTIFELATLDLFWEPYFLEQSKSTSVLNSSITGICVNLILCLVWTVVNHVETCSIPLTIKIPLKDFYIGKVLNLNLTRKTRLISFLFQCRIRK